MIGQTDSVKRKVQAISHNKVQERKIHAVPAFGFQHPVEEKFVRIDWYPLVVDLVCVAIPFLVVDHLSQYIDCFLCGAFGSQLGLHRFHYLVDFISQRLFIQSRIPVSGYQE